MADAILAHRNDVVFHVGFVLSQIYVFHGYSKAGIGTIQKLP
jgi:hypothetical protein